VTPQDYKQHPLSAAFPAMSGLDLQNLAEDLKANGQREPGVIYEGMVLDGWHRYLGCTQAGILFKAVEFDGADPVAFVLSRNLHRRHLTASQRAASIVACTNWKPRGKQAPGAGLASEQDMAKAAEVSERTIRHAKVAHQAGLSEEVKEGKVSAKRAAEVAKLPPKQREKALNQPPQPKPKKESPEEQTIVALRAEIADLKEALGEATLMAEAAKIHEGEEGFRDLKAVLGELEAVKRRRDDLMRENAELKKQVAHWRKRAEKAEAKVK
jgi:hypothetical protein